MKRVVKSIISILLSGCMAGQYCLPVFAQEESSETVSDSSIPEGIESNSEGSSGSSTGAVVVTPVTPQPQERQIIASGQCGETVEWVLYDDRTLNIFGTGETYDYAPSESPFVYLSVENVIVEEGVTYIGSHVFDHLNILTMKLPTSLNSVGKYAFAHLFIPSLTLPNGLTSLQEGAFYEGVIKSVTIPGTVSSIPSYCFEDSLVEQVVLLPGVESISPAAFYNAYKLAQIELNEGLKRIGKSAFSGTKIYEITLPGSLGIIESDSFKGANNLQSVKMNEGITEIYDYAFEDLPIAKVQFPNSLKIIGVFAFSRNRLTSVTIPGNVYKIGAYAFSNGTIESLTIEDGVKKILKKAFSNNPIYKLDLPESLETVEDAFSETKIQELRILGTETEIVDDFQELQSIYLYKDSKADLSLNSKAYQKYFFDSEILLNGKLGNNVQWVLTKDGVLTFSGKGELDPSLGSVPEDVKEIVIEEGITSIENEMFTGSLVEKVTMADSVEYIKDAAFLNCENLTTIKLSSNLYSIGDSAFKNCIKLQNIVFPESLKEIKDAAFQNCDSLEFITIPKKLLIMGDWVFYDCDDLIAIYLYKDSSISMDPHAGPENWPAHVLDEKNSMQCGENMYVLYDSSTLYIYGTGKMYDSFHFLDYFDHKENSNYLIGNYRYLYIEEGVTSIKDYAFYGFYNLEKVHLPNTLQEIGEKAFYYLPIKEIQIPESVTKLKEAAFMDCQELRKIKLSDNIDSIEADTFFECKELREVNIPENARKIGNRAFYNCKSLNNIRIPSKVTFIDEQAFSKCKYLDTVTIEGNVKSIEAETFYACENLRTVVLPDSIEEIKESAFYECYLLKNINMPSSLKTLGDSCFEDCNALEKVILPESTLNIGSSVFLKCNSLKEIQLPSKLEYIPWKMLAHTAIEHITYPKNLKEIKGYAFAFTNLKEFSIPDTVYDIGSHAFEGCDFKEVVITDQIQNLGTSVFTDCKNLESVIYNTVYLREYIPNYTFSGCESLKNVILNGYTSMTIGNNAFEYCSSLKNIQIPENTHIFEYAFAKSGLLELNGIALSIHNDAFAFCKDLATIKLIDSNNISEDAFEGSNIKDVYVEKDSYEDKYFNQETYTKHYISDPLVEGYSLTLDGDTTLHYYLNIYRAQKYLEDTVITSGKGHKEIRKKLKEFPIKEIEGISYYDIPYIVSAKNMLEYVNITIQKDIYNYIYLGYSLYDYFESILENEQNQDPKTIQIVKTMMTYAFYTNQYFETNNFSLEFDPEPVENIDFSSYAQEIIDENDSIHYIGARLVLSNRVSLKLYFDGNEEFTCNGNKIETQKEGNFYTITIEDIKDMREMFDIRTDHFRMKYGIFSYANIASQTNKQDLINLMNSLYAYNALFYS